MDSVSNFVEDLDVSIAPCCNAGFSVQCFNVIVELVPVDSDNDGTPDTEEVTVLSNTFDAGTTLGCGFDFVVSFTPDGNTPSQAFDCDDIGTNSITIYYVAENGITDQCQVDLIVEDNNNEDICP